MKPRGFTLIEICIVLLIIALLVGAIVVGKEMVAASEIFAVLTQKQQYEGAVKTFHDRYDCLPGDCANAVSLGFAENGNGDSHIETAIFHGNHSESVHFWQDMNNVHLIDVPHNLSDLPGSNMGRVGWHTPTIVVPNATSNTGAPGGWWILWMDELTWNDINGFAANNPYEGHYFALVNDVIDNTNAALLSPMTALRIDAKIDDGKPFSGKAGAGPSWMLGNPLNTLRESSRGTAGSAVCVDTDAVPPAYNIANPEFLCSLVMKAPF